MTEDLDGGAPGAGGVLGFGIPEFAEGGGFAVELGEDGDPFFTEGIPGDGASVGFDFLAVDGGDLRLGFEMLPLCGVLPGFEGGGDAEGGEGVAEVGPLLAIGMGVDDGMAFGCGRRLGGIGVMVPENFEGVEILGVFIPMAEAELVDVEEVSDF